MRERMLMIDDAGVVTRCIWEGPFFPSQFDGRRCVRVPFDSTPDDIWLNEEQ